MNMTAYAENGRRRTLLVEVTVGPDSLLDQVDDGVETDPDDVDEVPVVGHDDGAGRLLRGEPPYVSPGQQQDEGDEAAEHVQPVKAGRDVEDRAVGVGLRGEVVE